MFSIALASKIEYKFLISLSSFFMLYWVSFILISEKKMFKTSDSNADLLYPVTFYQQFTRALWIFLASIHVIFLVLD